MANSHGPRALGRISGGASTLNVASKILVFPKYVNEVDKAWLRSIIVNILQKECYRAENGAVRWQRTHVPLKGQSINENSALGNRVMKVSLFFFKFVRFFS